MKSPVMALMSSSARPGVFNFEAMSFLPSFFFSYSYVSLPLHKYSPAVELLCAEMFDIKESNIFHIFMLVEQCVDTISEQVFIQVCSK